MVELDEGICVMAGLAGNGGPHPVEVRVNVLVEIVFDDFGDQSPMLRFRPA